MNKKKMFSIFILFFCLVLVSGCVEKIFVSDGVTYQECTTKTSYTISYGYQIKCSGEGKLNVIYECDTPEVLDGQTSILEALYPEYENITLASFNNMKKWNLSKNTCNEFNLGLKASVVAEVFLVSDLTGEDALSIEDIKENYPGYVSKYCKVQSNESKRFIDPENAVIKNQANLILSNSGTNNSFVVAKEIFTWLKQNTEYLIHNPGFNDVQTCYETYNKKTGDCDDLSFLYISLCRAIDIPARFIRGFLVSQQQATPHAWVEVFVGGNIGDDGWIPVECAGTATGEDKIEAEINQNFGIESANHLRLFKDDGSNASLEISFTGIVYSSDSGIDLDTPEFFVEIVEYEELLSNKLHIDEDNIRSLK